MAVKHELQEMQAEVAAEHHKQPRGEEAQVQSRAELPDATKQGRAGGHASRALVQVPKFQEALKIMAH